MPKLDHIAFQVGDMDASIRFYVEKLGFKLVSRSTNLAEQEEFVFLASGDLELELLQDLKEPEHSIPEPKPPYCPHLAFRTQDMERTIAELEEKGIPILRGPLSVQGEETWLYLTDPDNNVIEYIQWFRKK